MGHLQGKGPEFGLESRKWRLRQQTERNRGDSVKRFVSTQRRGNESCGAEGKTEPIRRGKAITGRQKETSVADREEIAANRVQGGKRSEGDVRPEEEKKDCCTVTHTAPTKEKDPCGVGKRQWARKKKRQEKEGGGRRCEGQQCRRVIPGRAPGERIRFSDKKGVRNNFVQLCSDGMKTPLKGNIHPKT